MDCPHCGGPIDSGARKPLKHPCFDDRYHCIIVGEEQRYVRPGPWRVLLLLRERFERFVPHGFLAQYSAADPLDGGSTDSTKVHVTRLRARLRGSPFAIATQHNLGYGLFPVGEVAIGEDRGNGRRFYRAVERAPATTVAQWSEEEI
jgi:hypothetical protein